MPSNSVILKVAGEGGSVVLYGLREGDGWRFSLDFIGADPDSEQVITDSWEGALFLLDRYFWPMLGPDRVHPEFKDRILAAVEERCVAEGISSSAPLQRWGGAPVDASEVDSPRHSSDSWLYDLDD